MPCTPAPPRKHDPVIRHLHYPCCRTDVFDDCAVPRLFVDIVKLPLKPPPLCVAWLDEADAVLKAIPFICGEKAPRRFGCEHHAYILVAFYLVVGQMFLMIVPCLVYLLTLLSFH
jgi:hypothetical protein